ncbi:glucose-6-phosphate isomerase [Fluviibacter phosphoraccumulans]|uniref:glucose-6-phosphate isomerase n=1 Tax=Fluviibacter phosphoraccumulans TaxID=1751046 RepID=UPI0024E20DC9|nr:glucose-6-phosphate isomerase [Fluviibacter phosphoraccumulans]
MSKDLTQTPAWTRLSQARDRLAKTHLRELFAADPQRFENFSRQTNELLLDFSKQRLDDEVLDALVTLAEDTEVPSWRERLFAGEKINVSEERAVLHPALRHLEETPFPSAAHDVMPAVREVRAQMAVIVEKLRSGSWKGYSGETIRHVVNIGIGGSDLGPKMATRALSAFAHPGLHVHYVSNLDGAHLAPLLETLDPRSTLFIIASKTFTTQETMINAASARNWMLAHTGTEASLAKHFVAVSAHPERAAEFGIPPAQVLPMWDWVGGRYSLWSAVGLPLAISIGMSGFERLLAGAQAMDQHFCQAPLKDNLPVLLALLGIWNTNFLGAHTSAIVPYNESLRHLPGYLQQLEMESNGKTVNRDGQPLTCPANPIVWGEIGANGQHAFFQLLHQGGWLVPCDFIATALSDYPLPGHQAPLLANCFAQSAALAFGKTEDEARTELDTAKLSAMQRDALLPHKVFAGNQPSTTLLLPRLDPYHLGLLLALYEHKVFVQGVIWGINSFDQWGVELGKQLASRVLPVLNGDAAKEALDASTRGLIEWTQTTHG